MLPINVSNATSYEAHKVFAAEHLDASATSDRDQTGKSSRTGKLKPGSVALQALPELLSDIAEAVCMVRVSDTAVKHQTIPSAEEKESGGAQQEPQHTRRIHSSKDDLSFGVYSPSSKQAFLMHGLLSDETAMTCPWTRRTVCGRRISHHGGLDDPLFTDCEYKEAVRHAASGTRGALPHTAVSN